MAPKPISSSVNCTYLNVLASYVAEWGVLTISCNFFHVLFGGKFYHLCSPKRSISLKSTHE